MPQTLAVIGAVATVGGTLYSVKQQQKAAQLQQRQQELATRRSQRQAIREAQIRRAQTLASSQALGVSGGSSSVSGGLASLGSQVGGALGFSSQMSGLSGQISEATNRAAIGSAIAGIGGTAFNLGVNFGGADRFLLPASTVPTGVARPQVNYT